MKELLDLKDNNGFKWFENNNVLVKGYCFYKDIYLEEYHLINQIEKCKVKSDFINLIKELNGSYLILYYLENELLIAVDRLRSIPVFLEVYNKCVIRVCDKISGEYSELNKKNLDFFYGGGFTLGQSTLLNDFLQLTAGQFCCISLVNFNFKIENYYEHLHNRNANFVDNVYYKKLDEITDRFIERLILSAKGRSIVLPLSGGYDSRYIATGLKRMGFKNVICYSYGDKQSFEIDLARKVANTLGFEFHEVIYSKEDWVALMNDADFREFLEYSFNFSSLPHIQEFIAVKRLKTSGIINESSIIVPGFCGDVLGGSFLPVEVLERKESNLLKKGIVKYILNRHFKFSNSFNESKENRDFFLENWNKKYDKPNDIDSFISYNESWVTEHRLSKFVVNSVRVYEYFGMEWRLPLWDNELVEFWYKIPNNLRIKKKMYDKYLLDVLFKENKVDFVKDGGISSNDILFRIRALIPNIFLKYIKIFYRKFFLVEYDINNFDILKESIQKELSIDKKTLSKLNFNGVLAHWIIKIKEK